MATLDESEYHGCASHQPVLCAIGEGLSVDRRNTYMGPVIECGSGLYSTPLLHFIAYMMRVGFVACERLPEWGMVVRDWTGLGASVIPCPDDEVPGGGVNDWGPSLLHVDGTVEQRRPFVEWGLQHADIITHHDMDDCARYGTCELMRSAPLYMEYTPPNRSFGGNRPGTIFGTTGVALTRPELYPAVIEALKRVGCK